MSNISEGYSFSEKRDIVTLTQDSQALHRMVDSVLVMKTVLAAQPDMEWNEFCKDNPIFLREDEVGYGILKNNFELYRSSRDAAIQWGNNLHSGDNVDSFKRVLGIPDDYAIDLSQISVMGHTLVIHLSHEQVQDVTHFRLEKSCKNALDKSQFIVAGSASVGHLAEDDTSGCPIIFVPREEENTSTLDHEFEHAVVNDFYFRTTEPIEAPDTTAYDVIYSDLQENMHLLQPEIRKKAFRRSFQYMLQSIQLYTFYNEVIAENTKTSQYGIRTDEYLKLPGIGRITVRHSYQSFMLDLIEAFSDNVRHEDYTEEEKVQMIYGLYEEVRRFEKQNEKVASWVRRLEEAYPSPAYRTAVLECIPAERPWVIGNFINAPPEELRKQYQDEFSSDAFDEADEEKEKHREHERQENFWRFILYEKDFDIEKVKAEFKARTAPAEEALSKVDFQSTDAITPDLFDQIYIPSSENRLKTIRDQIQTAFAKYRQLGLQHLPENEEWFTLGVESEFSAVTLDRFGIDKLARMTTKGYWTSLERDALYIMWNQYVNHREEGRTGHDILSFDDIYTGLERMEASQEAFRASLKK